MDKKSINIYRFLFLKVGIKRLAISFSSNFGWLWLFLEPASFFVPEKLDFGISGYISLTIASFIIALFQNFPKKIFAANLSSPDTEIEIKIGDLFDENAHLVIGCNDVFDTRLGEIIKDSSVQGQFLRKVYNRNQQQLDTEIESVLKEYNYHPKQDLGKIQGKNLRYPIGTTVTLGAHERKFFLVAYGYMNRDLTVDSNPKFISVSLDKLWQEVRRKCHGTPVSIPIVGSDLARSGLSRKQLTKLIITSFVLASKHRFITQKLTVMVHPKDLNSVDWYSLQEFLDSVCF